VPDERITVTPEAAAAHFQPQPQSEVTRVRAQYGLGPRYMLAVGNLQPRKNLERLLGAFAILAPRFPEVQLALVGQKGWRGAELDSAVRRLGLESRVRLTGYVPDVDLADLYSGAEVFCYPSLYEGFGLPVLEAMACGAPVVTSTSSSLPEVAGEAAVLVDPTSVGELVRALGDVLSADGLRESLRRKGTERASNFSWQRTAALTAGVYDAVLRTHPEARSSRRLASSR
jgi:glycosyltransferase involved in cell wall biosynthesis